MKLKSILKTTKILALTAALVLPTLAISNTANANYNYSDVDKSHWAYSQIQEATKLGILKGNENGTFAPDRNVSKAEMAQIIARLFSEDKRVKEPFADLDDTHWATPAIEELLALGIINPNDYVNGLFEADKPMSRMEMAKWLTKTLAVKQTDYKGIEDVIRTSQHTIIPVTEFYKGELKRPDFGYAGIMLGTGMFTGYEDGSFKPNQNTIRAEVATLAIRLNSLLGKKPSSFTALNEIVEVSKTATNMTSISPFLYLTENKFNTVTNKWVNYGKLGQMKLHQAIFIPYGSYAEAQKSIYGKMFVDKDSRFYANSYEVFVHKTFNPNVTGKVDLFTFIGSSNDVFYASYSPQMKVAKSYGYGYLPNSDLTFTKDKSVTYWSSFNQRTGSGEGNGTIIKYGESEFLYHMK